MVGGDDRVTGAHDRAVGRTLNWIEKNAVETRMRAPATRAAKFTRPPRDRSSPPASGASARPRAGEAILPIEATIGGALHKTPNKEIRAGPYPPEMRSRGKEQAMNARRHIPVTAWRRLSLHADPTGRAQQDGMFDDCGPLAYGIGDGVRMGRGQEQRLFRASRLRLRLCRPHVPRSAPDRHAGPPAGLWRGSIPAARHRGRAAYVVVYTIRGSAVRIISARKANPKEVADYEHNARQN